MLERKSDDELVDAIKQGCQESYEALVSRYNRKVFQLASRMMRDQEDAEEVLQDVFVTVYRKIAGFEGKSSFSSWLYRVTVNSALMKLRKRKKVQHISVDDTENSESTPPQLRSREEDETDRAALRRQILNALEKAIGELPEDYRPVFILRDVDGLTSTEVGKILNLSVPAVKSRLHRSRLMLRKSLEGFYSEYRTGTKAEPLVGNM